MPIAHRCGVSHVSVVAKPRLCSVIRFDRGDRGPSPAPRAGRGLDQCKRARGARRRSGIPRHGFLDLALGAGILSRNPRLWTPFLRWSVSLITKLLAPASRPGRRIRHDQVSRLLNLIRRRSWFDSGRQDDQIKLTLWQLVSRPSAVSAYRGDGRLDDLAWARGRRTSMPAASRSQVAAVQPSSRS